MDWPTDVKDEFISPYPLEESARRLSARHEPRRVFAKYEERLYVKILQESEDIYRFHIQKIHNLAKEPGGIGEGDFFMLIGVMGRSPGGRTQVVVGVVPDHLRMIFNVGGLLLAVLLVGAVITIRLTWPYDALFAIIVLCLVILGIIVFPRRWRTTMEGMITMIRETLDAIAP